MAEEGGRRPNKRRELGAQSREAILDSALALMAESGYDGVSIARLAKESGLPASSIYWHFGSKAGVLAAVMERGADVFFSLTEDEQLPAAASVDDSLEALRIRFHQGRRAAQSHPEFLRLLFLLTLSEPGDERVAGIIARVNDRGREVLHHQISEAFTGLGATRAREIADRLTLPALAIFNGIFLTLQTNPDASLEALIDAMVGSVHALALQE